MQASACNFTERNTPPWVFFTFLKLYEWYQITQSTTHLDIVSKIFLPFDSILRWKAHILHFELIIFQRWLANINNIKWNLLNFLNLFHANFTSISRQFHVYFTPISRQCSISIPPKSIRKHLVFSCFQGEWKRNPNVSSVKSRQEFSEAIFSGFHWK